MLSFQCNENSPLLEGINQGTPKLVFYIILILDKLQLQEQHSNQFFTKKKSYTCGQQKLNTGQRLSRNSACPVFSTGN